MNSGVLLLAFSLRPPQIPLKEMRCIGNGFRRDTSAVVKSLCSAAVTPLYRRTCIWSQKGRRNLHKEKAALAFVFPCADTQRPESRQKALRAFLGSCSLQQVLKRKKKINQTTQTVRHKKYLPRPSISFPAGEDGINGCWQAARRS